MVSEPRDDKALEEYLRRKSALSMGYKKIYVEAPPVELDRAIAARARRALRWLVPGILAACIALGLMVVVNIGVSKLMQATVSAERNALKIRKEQNEELERERARQPIAVVIDAKDIPKEEAREAAAAAEELKIKVAAREQWLAKIEALKRDGKQAEADAELRRFQKTYPDSIKP